jgi:hypothetical protein
MAKSGKYYGEREVVLVGIECTGVLYSGSNNLACMLHHGRRCMFIIQQLYSNRLSRCYADYHMKHNCVHGYQTMTGGATPVFSISTNQSTSPFGNMFLAVSMSPTGIQRSSSGFATQPDEKFQLFLLIEVFKDLENLHQHRR